MGWVGEVVSERLTYPPTLKPVFLIEGQRRRVEKSLGREFMADNKIIFKLNSLKIDKFVNQMPIVIHYLIQQ